MKFHRKVVVGAGFAIVTLAALAACGRVSRPSESIIVRPWVKPTAADGSTTSSTECQDHTLPCAGPPITGVSPPVEDPSRHDTTVIGRAIHDLDTPTTTPRTLVRTS